MNHNLFTHPTEVVVDFDAKGKFIIKDLIESQNLMDVLDDMDYDKNFLDKKLKYMLEESKSLSSPQKRELLGKLYLYLSENSYLKTIQASNDM